MPRTKNGSRNRRADAANKSGNNRPGRKAASSRQQKNLQICHAFQQVGTCSRGDACRFQHPAPPQSQSVDRSLSEPSRLVADFAARISATVRNRKFRLSLDDPHTRSLWMQTWAACASSTNIPYGADLIRALMKLPDSTAIFPPVAHVLQVLHAVSKMCAQKSGHVMATLQIVADVIESRLMHRADLVPVHSLNVCIDTVKDLRIAVHTALLHVLSDVYQSERASHLLGRMLSLLERYARQLEKQENDGERNDVYAKEQTAIAWIGWRNPTLSWLQFGKWLDIPSVRDEYESIDDYVDKSCQLVTMMTFYWGAGALFPKCRHKGPDDRTCDQPLVRYIRNSNRSCGRKLSKGSICNSPVNWGCSRHSHDASCARCLRKIQNGLVGHPGHRASTDIYDAVVERETRRRDGYVYIVSGLKSRKPPSIAPNWKTTYRLNCCALVAVIRLSASYQPLSRESRIEWAEVVPVNIKEGSVTDFQNRKNGRMAFRFLSKTDLSTLEVNSEPLEAGTHLAIIDLQVFVPEVISVLSTTSDSAFGNHLKQLPFSERLIGSEPLTPMKLGSQNVGEVLADVVASTELNVIRKLPHYQQKNLLKELTALAKRFNLYGTQLEAFSAALSTSLHCTQGPPGTGKSYVGVALIHALDIIRSYAIGAGDTVGPIVVLSYKNHALEEILLDVLKSSKRGGISSGLIRCGRSEDTRLEQYGEKSSPAERAAEKVLTHRISCLRTVQRVSRDWYSLSSILSSASTGDAQNELRSWKPIHLQDDTFSGHEPFAVSFIQAVILSLRSDDSTEHKSHEEAFEILAALPGGSIGLSVGEECALLEKINGLQTDMEHWHAPPDVCRPVFLLENWLIGRTPPPRCQANREGENGCLLSSPREGSYCVELHDCKFSRPCERRRIEGILFCNHHRCMVDTETENPCPRPRVDDSTVCLEHACRWCLHLHRSPILPRVDQACTEHTCREDKCGNMYLSNMLPFCRKHCCRICGYASVNEGIFKVMSVRRTEASEFCEDHKCIVPDCTGYRIHDHMRQDFCGLHACAVCHGKRQLVDKNIPHSRVCPDHRCKHVDPATKVELCQYAKEPDSLFCRGHICQFCRDEKLPLNRQVEDFPPRNACAIHLLCSHISVHGEMCNSRVPHPHQKYCLEHVQRKKGKSRLNDGVGVKRQCEGTTSKRKRCKSRGFSDSKTYFCDVHLDQAPESSSESEKEDDLEDGYESAASKERAVIDWEESEGELLKTVNATLSHDPLENQETGDRTVQNQRSSIGNDLKGSDADDSVTSEDTVASEDTAICPGLAHPIESSNEEVNKDRPDASDADLRNSDLATNGKMCGVSGSSTGSQSFCPNHIEQGKSQDLESPIAAEDEKVSSDLAESDEEDSSTNTVSSEDSNRGVERIVFGTCPDELDIASSESDSSGSELPEQLQHLRDIVGGDEASGSESEEDLAPINDEKELIGETFTSQPGAWSWNQPLSERWYSAAVLLRRVCMNVDALLKLADGYVERARDERAEASAYTLKMARVIGATVVGATKRLHAIRASEPFAMVVEEACEVLEPTLVSVLAVKSLRKLELIGDHRQLPAFVQQSWFALQMTHPFLKVSLFERLVKSDANMGGDSACTILDEQRRMRPEICDLTRVEYSDVVDIQDNKVTISQLVGDRSRSPTLIEERNLWHKKGSVIPGVKQQVFFWNLDFKEQRAAVGLSRCNHGEAEACASLVNWLMYCGVPPNAITVITPYKGQKLTIIQELRRRKSSNQRITDVFVSTVDRYQGDENDIVILSLVSTRPGNRFVALRNRFIVACSRARLGFYILGSSHAVSKTVRGGDGPSHWCRLLQDLEIPGKPCSTNQNMRSKNFRIGRKLMLRCPRHEEIEKEVSNANEIPQNIKETGNFCSIQCSFKLPWCGHSCSLPCHSISRIAHSSNCEVPVLRPCSRHQNVSLICSDVKKEMEKMHSSLGEALESFKCEVEMEYYRFDCSHSVMMPCHAYDSLMLDGSRLSPCTRIVGDYVHPSCGHVREKPKCFERLKWEDEPPLCFEKVVHERKCGCKAQMACHKRIAELSMDNPPRCQEAVVTSRPRCSHRISIRCYEATLLRDLWYEEEGESILSNPPLVIHGLDYGRSESALSKLYPCFDKILPTCGVMTSYRMSCGHIRTGQCSEVFELAMGLKDEPVCRDKCNFKSPICGHNIEASCRLRSISQKNQASVWREMKNDEGVFKQVATEADILAALPIDSDLSKLNKLCPKSVSVILGCGHEVDGIRCSNIGLILKSKKLPLCRTRVEISRSCGHVYQTTCSQLGEQPPPCTNPVDDWFTFPCGKLSHRIQPGTCSELSRLQNLTYPKCETLVRCVRARCTHSVEVPCYHEIDASIALPGKCLDPGSTSLIVESDVDYCEERTGFVDCLEPIMYRRQCGHVESDVPCKLAFDWSACIEDPPPCQKLVEIDSPLCKHSLQVSCCFKGTMLALNPWGGEPPERIVLHLGDDVTTCPVVNEYCAPVEPSKQMISLLHCGRTTRMIWSCGHEEDVPCEKVFSVIHTPCTKLESTLCTTCENVIEMKCHELRDASFPIICKNLVEKKCSTCKINSTKVECYREATCCEKEVHADLSCGHPVSWKCGDVDPRTKVDTEPCITCTRLEWETALSRVGDFLEHQKKEHSLTRAVKNAIHASAAEARMGKAEGPKQSGVFNAPLLFEELKTRVLNTLPSSSVVNQKDRTPVDVEPLLRAYLDIAQRHSDLLGEAIINEADDGIVVGPPPDISDAEGSYNIIYEVIGEGNPKYVLRPVETQYGRGVRGRALNIERLYKDFSERSGGDFNIVVAAALNYRCASDVKPFRPERSDIKHEKNTASFAKQIRKQDRKARKVMQQYIGKGFDYASRADESLSHVYWIPDCIVPLFELTLELQETCQVCMEEVSRRAGWFCPNVHFLCRECFVNYAMQAKRPDAIASAINENGMLRCPERGCDTIYEPLLLLSQPHDASQEELHSCFEALQNLKLTIHTKQEVHAALDEQRRQLEAEFQRIQHIEDREERRAETLRLEITDRILTLRCPNKACRRAFLDFDGCFAVRCLFCGVSFCAWCIDYYSDDAHAHVLTCAESTAPGEYYESLEAFNRHQRQRRKRLLVEKLGHEDTDVRNRTLKLIRTDLEDLGIILDASHWT